MNPPKPAIRRKLNGLISLGRAIAGDAVAFDFFREDAGIAVRFKEDAVDLLADLGGPFGDLRSEVKGIPAVKSESTCHFNREGVPDGKQIIDVVDPPKIRRIVKYLIKARRRLDAESGLVVQDQHGTLASKTAPPAKKAPGPYSPTDHKIFESIGEEEFRALPNNELYQRHWVRASNLLRKRVEPEMFRDICKRIRHHHGLPNSASIRTRVKLRRH
jgi:hypothetical protein